MIPAPGDDVAASTRALVLAANVIADTARTTTHLMATAKAHQVESAAELSPSHPLDAPYPSAVLEVSTEEYDALVDELEATTEPSEALRRTMSLHRLPRE